MRASPKRAARSFRYWVRTITFFRGSWRAWRRRFCKTRGWACSITRFLNSTWEQASAGNPGKKAAAVPDRICRDAPLACEERLHEKAIAGAGFPGLVEPLPGVARVLDRRAEPAAIFLVDGEENPRRQYFPKLEIYVFPLSDRLFRADLWIYESGSDARVEGRNDGSHQARVSNFFRAHQSKFERVL